MSDHITVSQIRACLRAVGDIAESGPLSAEDEIVRCQDAAVIQDATYFDEMPALVGEMLTTFRRLAKVTGNGG
jgi:hypothetical protein